MDLGTCFVYVPQTVGGVLYPTGGLRVSKAIYYM